MEPANHRPSPSATDDRTERTSVDPDLPSLGGVLIGSILFLAGGTLMFTVIGIPAGLLLFAAGLGLMLEPKPRDRR